MDRELIPSQGYFIYFKGELVSQHTLFAMLWKEYTLSDSRYLTGDVFTLCIETITVVRLLSSLFSTSSRFLRKLLTNR